MSDGFKKITVGAYFFFKFSRKLTICGTIWTPVEDFFPPPIPYRGDAFLRGGIVPLNQTG